MSVIINPIITNAGLNVFTPMATGIEFTFTHVAVGTGTSAVNASATALENEIDRFTIAGGGVIAGGKAVSINALVTNHANANPQDYDITEFGFYGLDGNNNTVLFAIHRQNTTIVHKVSGADIALSFVIGLSALPTENMTVTIDTNTSGALALLGQHVANAHPHTQYKRTLDNTEQLKIANGTANDHAVSKGQLDSAINTKANLGGSNTQRFKVANAVDNDEAVSKSQLNSAVSGVPPADLSGKADLAGSSTQTFSVAAATANDHAVSKGQLDSAINTKANLGGSNTQRFKVANAVDNDEAVSKSQLNAEATARQNADNDLQQQINNLTLSILGKAWPIGSVYENRFDARNPSHQDLLGFGTWVTLGEGRITVGYQSGDPDFGTIGQAGGQKNHTMTADNLIAHQHQAHDNTVLINLQSLPFTHQYDGTSYNHYFSSESPSDAMSHPAGQANPDPIPTLPPYIVVIRWVRTA